MQHVASGDADLIQQGSYHFYFVRKINGLMRARGRATRCACRRLATLCSRFPGNRLICLRLDASPGGDNARDLPAGQRCTIYSPLPPTDTLIRLLNAVHREPSSTIVITPSSSATAWVWSATSM